MIAPLESWTVPLIDPLLCANVKWAANMNSRLNHQSLFPMVNFIFPPTTSEPLQTGFASKTVSCRAAVRLLRCRGKQIIDSRLDVNDFFLPPPKSIDNT